MAPATTMFENTFSVRDSTWDSPFHGSRSTIRSKALKEELPNSAIEPLLRNSEVKIPQTIDQLIRQRAEEQPDEAIVSYPSVGIEYVDYTSKQLDAFAFRVAQRYKTMIPQRTTSLDSETVVGLLGPSNFEYFISILALTKLGHTVLFLSTRISLAAYASLAESTGAKHLIVHPSFREIAEQVKSSIPALGIHDITDSSPFNSIIEDEHLDTRLDRNFDVAAESCKNAWIIHSSGSTGLPKPIYQTHEAALRNYSSNLNLRGFVTLPLFHAHGISCVFRAIMSRKQIYLYPADLPLTQHYLFEIMQRYDIQIFYGVPYALKVLGETPGGISALSKMKVVMFGGSACPDALGDRLVENGVNLVSHYGTTETGQVMTSFRELGDKAWDYVRVPSAFASYISFEPRSDGLYELVALEGLPSKVATNRPDGSYATKDLFTPHPSIPNAWKYFARMDDTIVLMNGEKVTPTAFEQSVRDNSYVTEAVMFGSGKARVGIIIIPSETAKDLSEDQIATILLPTLAKSNEAMPGYAQLSMEMIKVLPSGTKYPRTDKGTVIRARFYRDFESQIEAVYENSEVSSGELCLSEAELRDFLRSQLSEIASARVSSSLEDDTDFFSVGIDSLQAIRLRSAITKNIETNGVKLTSNIVFDFPSINSLAHELYRLRTGGTSVSVSVEDQMRELISKYSQFDAHIPKDNSSEGHHLVVTGATGSLGAHLVSQLALQAGVKSICCLVRASSIQQARFRVIQSMRARCVYHHLPLEARRKVVAVPSDFGKATLGLSPEVYSEIASNITGLVHCAWSVNFNLGLGSFEADCIAGAHNLLGLCLKSQRPEPATFNFCSSVSAVAATKGGFVKEALPETLDCAQNMGYAQSKLVTENICIAAAKAYGIKSRVLRVGQVVADTAHGIWNATEAIPLMLQAATTIGAIPCLDENPLWLPVDVVASAVAEISLSTAPAAVVNVVNPQSFHWTRDLLPALHRTGLQFSEPKPKEWVEMLRNSDPDPVANPPVKLLEFFAKKYDNDGPPKIGLTYDTSFGRFLSPSLAAAPILDQPLVDNFVRCFQKNAWGSSIPSSPSTFGRNKRLITIAGPCGAGKSTIARAISEKFNIPWLEGDNMHSQGSVEKMSQGIALSDEDRWVWLETIKGTALISSAKEGHGDIIVTCSALKKEYRDVLRDSRVLKPVFVVLQATAETLSERVRGRDGHFMGEDMVGSQVLCLEGPGIEETDVIPVDVGRAEDEVLREVVELLGLN